MVALFLQLFYWKPWYVDHLVFSLYLHSFSFLVLVVGAFVDGAIGVMGFDSGGTGNSVATLAIAVYAFLALRRVYGQGRLATTLKLVVLILSYSVALVFTMLAQKQLEEELAKSATAHQGDIGIQQVIQHGIRPLIIMNVE